MATLAALSVWVLIIYQAIPRDIFVPVEAKVIDMSANPVSRILKILLLVIGGALVLRRSAAAMSLLKRTNVFFRVFLLLVPLSYLWSISPADTFARFISILSTVVVCIAFCVTGWHPTRFQNVVRPIITVLLLGSVIFGLSAPDLAIEHGEGTLKDAWHGLLAQKNPFGQLATFGLIFWMHAALTRQAPVWRAVLGAALGFSCVLLSRSSTSLMVSLFVVLFMLMSLRSPPALRRYMPYLVGLFSVTVLTYALVVLNLLPGASILLEPIAAITGKDLTFSNRSEIWRIIKEHIELSPIVGSGYGAYWIGPVPWSPSFTFLGQMYFYPTESHNGYLEIVNDLGYLGLIVLLGFLVVFVRQSLRLARVDRAQGVLFLALFFQQAIMNLSESCWLAINSGFIFSLMALAVIALARASMETGPALAPAPSARARWRGRLRQGRFSSP